MQYNTKLCNKHIYETPKSQLRSSFHKSQQILKLTDLLSFIKVSLNCHLLLEYFNRELLKSSGDGQQDSFEIFLVLRIIQLQESPTMELTRNSVVHIRRKFFLCGSTHRMQDSMKCCERQTGMYMLKEQRCFNQLKRNFI